MEEPWQNIRDSVANNRRLLGMEEQPMKETHSWDELATAAVGMAMEGLSEVLTKGETRKAANCLLQAATLMKEAADKRAAIHPKPVG